jgi:molybdopterin molybdotransferase
VYLDSKSFVSKEQALQMLLQRWQFPKKTDFVTLQNARGRICILDIYSKNTLPVYRNSQLDGIAVRFSDFEKGMPDTSSWRKGIDYAAADTGDDFDDTFDTVIPIEDVTYLENQQLVIHPEESVKKGQYVSQSGENIKTGDLLVRKG